MRLTKKEGSVLEFVVLVLFLVGSYIFRFVDAFQSIWASSIDKTFYEIAYVTNQEFVYTSTDFVECAYVHLLHFVCLIFGNDYFLCALVHFLVLSIAMLVWYFAFKKLLGTLISMIIFACGMLLPYCIRNTISCSPIALFLLFGGILFWVIVSCIKMIIKIVKSNRTSLGVPVVTVVNFDEEKAVSVPLHEKERSAIFIPKSMEIPKRQPKPKLDYSLEVAKDAMFYDVDPEQHDDFDFL